MQKDTAYSLTLQIFTAGHWHDAMRLEFPEPQRGFVGPCRFHYRQDYLADHLDPQTVYQVSVITLPQVLRVGNRVRIVYSGPITVGGVPGWYVNIDHPIARALTGWFDWITSATAPVVHNSG